MSVADLKREFYIQNLHNLDKKKNTERIKERNGKKRNGPITQGIRFPFPQ